MSDIPGADEILKKLESIHSDIAQVHKDLVYLKTRDEEQKREWPQTQSRIKLVEDGFVRTDRDMAVVGATLSEMSRTLGNLDKKISKISEDTIPEIHKDVEALKVRATIWGGLAGTFLATVITISIKVFDFFMRS